jgi:L-ascorbate oxidase
LDSSTVLMLVVIGMQTVWVMGNQTEIMAVPAEHVQGYLSYGGSVNGNETHHPHVVHFKGGDA